MYDAFQRPIDRAPTTFTVGDLSVFVADTRLDRTEGTDAFATDAQLSVRGERVRPFGPIHPSVRDEERQVADDEARRGAIDGALEGFSTSSVPRPSSLSRPCCDHVSRAMIVAFGALFQKSWPCELKYVPSDPQQLAEPAGLGPTRSA